MGQRGQKENVSIAAAASALSLHDNENSLANSATRRKFPYICNNAKCAVVAKKVKESTVSKDGRRK